MEETSLATYNWPNKSFPTKTGSLLQISKCPGMVIKSVLFEVDQLWTPVYLSPVWTTEAELEVA